jgi:hypothetical protein
MSKLATILAAFATLSPEDKLALAGALTSNDEPAAPEEPIVPSAGPADPRSIAREIVKAIMKAGKLWAGRTWFTPRVCDWAGHLVTDRRGAYLFCLSCVREDNSIVLCKKVALDANGMPSGAVYGQTVVRTEEQLTDLGPYNDVRADSSALKNTVPKAPRKVRQPAKSPESQPKAAPKAPAPAPAPEAKSPESLAIPEGASHVVVVDPSGADATFDTTGERVRVYITGRAAKKILSGSHKVWSREGFGYYFECNGERCGS